MAGDQMIEIAGLLVTVVGGREAIAAGLRWWAGESKRRAQAKEKRELMEAKAELVEAEQEVTTTAWLRNQINKIEKECREDRQRMELQRREDQKACDERVAAIESRQALVEGQVAEQARASADLTGKIRIEARREVRRSLSQPNLLVKPEDK